MTLIVRARQTLGSFTLDAEFSTQGGVTALFGGSGSGKTSLLRVIAGLSKPDQGQLIVEGKLLLDTQAGIFVPKHRRRIGYVFQEGRLFPHLSVRQNLRYGRWFAPTAIEEAEFRRIVELLGITRLLERRPAKLSGGEMQRVAIGRALLSSPRLLLMDEPLASLDEQRKAEILPYLEQLRDEMSVPIIYVSHSVAEVARLADTVVIMREGQVEAVGTPSQVLSHSNDRRDAGVVLAGMVEAIDITHQLTTIRLSKNQIFVPHARVKVGQRVRLHIPERDVMVATQYPEGLSALNVLDGLIALMEPAGEGMVRVQLNCGGEIINARITALSAERLDLRPRKPVFAVIKTVALES